VSGPRLAEIFGHAPWLLWIYNVGASALTIAASEPRAGRFLFVESILHGHVPLWRYVHVVSSVLTTGVIAYAFKTSRIPLDRDRYIAAAGVTLVVIGSALGFLYTRDRIGLSAGVGYAMLVYVAVAAVLEGRPAAFARATAAKDGRPLPVRALGLRLAQACVAVIAAGWLIRTGELYFQLRDAGWENYQEWTTRYEELGGTSRPQTDLLMLLRDEAPRARPRRSTRRSGVDLHALRARVRTDPTRVRQFRLALIVFAGLVALELTLLTFVDTTTQRLQRAGGSFQLSNIATGTLIAQRLEVAANGFEEVRLEWQRHDLAAVRAVLRAQLVEVTPDGTALDAVRSATLEIMPSSSDCCALRFEPIPDSRWRSYRLDLGVGELSGRQLSLWAAPSPVNGRLTINGRPQRTLLGFSYESGGGAPVSAGCGARRREDGRAGGAGVDLQRRLLPPRFIC
jgi:hypothetical protein